MAQSVGQLLVVIRITYLNRSAASFSCFLLPPPFAVKGEAEESLRFWLSRSNSVSDPGGTLRSVLALSDAYQIARVIAEAPVQEV